MKPRTTPVPAISADVLEVLLLGWSDAGELTTFEPWELTERELRDVWRANRAAIRAEAQRRGLTTIWAERVFDLDPPPAARGREAVSSSRAPVSRRCGRRPRQWRRCRRPCRAARVPSDGSPTARSRGGANHADAQPQLTARR